MTKILDANRALIQKMAALESKAQVQTRQLESYMAMAHTDPLTQLANRRAFDDELVRRIAERQRRGTALSVAIFDLDHFKSLNDHFGHGTGDRVLAGVAKVLSESFRDMDVVARYGGEEFAVILPGTDAAVAFKPVSRVCTRFQSLIFREEGAGHRITLSGGLAEALPGEDGPALLKRADAALYAAKAAGRKRIYFHNGEICELVSVEEPTFAEWTYQL